MDTDAQDHAPDLFRNAEIAMYRAKADGRDRVRFHDRAANATWAHRQSMQRDLELAIKSASFETLYQPQVNAKTGVVAALQAHLRWPRNAHGMVHPSDFLPVAKNAGLIRELTASLILSACQAAAGWPELKVSVGLPSSFLTDERLIPTIARGLRKANLPGHFLEVLVKQDAFTDGEDASAFQIDALQELGVQVALDGFGFGTSSVGLLRVPSGNTDHHRFVGAVLDVAKSLGLTTCAVGVMHEEEAGLLRELGCDRLQGPFYGKPMSLLRCNRLLRTHGLLYEPAASEHPL